jgi:hypothetical protein
MKEQRRIGLDAKKCYKFVKIPIKLQACYHISNRTVDQGSDFIGQLCRIPVRCVVYLLIFNSHLLHTSFVLDWFFFLTLGFTICFDIMWTSTGYTLNYGIVALVLCSCQ